VHLLRLGRSAASRLPGEVFGEWRWILRVVSPVLLHLVSKSVRRYGLWPAASRSRCSPPLLRSLACDPESGADLGPGIATGAQAPDRLGYRSVYLLGQADHEDQGLDVAVADTTGVGAQDAPDERAVLVVLDLPPPPVRCQSVLDSIRPGMPGRW
jgi:hypothetical protein